MIATDGNLYERVNVEPADPAAGAPYTSPIGDNSRRMLISVYFWLQTAVGAGNRVPYVAALPNGQNERIIGLTPTLTPAATLDFFFFIQGGTSHVVLTGGGINSVKMGALALNNWIEPADQWVFNMYNMVAADQISSIRYSYWRQLLPNG